MLSRLNAGHCFGVAFAGGVTLLTLEFPPVFTLVFPPLLTSGEAAGDAAGDATGLADAVGLGEAAGLFGASGVVLQALTTAIEPAKIVPKTNDLFIFTSNIFRNADGPSAGRHHSRMNIWSVFPQDQKTGSAARAFNTAPYRTKGWTILADISKNIFILFRVGNSCGLPGNRTPLTFPIDKRASIEVVGNSGGSVRMFCRTD
jgi:hypothetical protein